MKCTFEAENKCTHCYWCNIINIICVIIYDIFYDIYFQYSNFTIYNYDIIWDSSLILITAIQNDLMITFNVQISVQYLTWSSYVALFKCISPLKGQYKKMPIVYLYFLIFQSLHDMINSFNFIIRPFMKPKYWHWSRIYFRVALSLRPFTKRAPGELLAITCKRVLPDLLNFCIYTPPFIN